MNLLSNPETTTPSVKSRLSNAVSVVCGAFMHLVAEMREATNFANVSDDMPHYLISDNLKRHDLFMSLHDLSEHVGISIEKAREIISKDNGLFGPFIIYKAPADSGDIPDNIASINS